MPTLPVLKMLAGMMPILHSPAVMTPGQFGPIRRDLEPASERFTLTMSIRMDMRSAFAKLTSERSVDAAVDAGEHVGPAFRVRRELDLQRIGIVVDDFIDVARIAAERAAHQRQGLADPPAGGGRGRRV